MINWQWCVLNDLSAAQLYAVLAAREAVFIVEQASIYQDLDGLDINARHLIAWSDGQVAAYLRVLGPATRFAEPSLGRILTTRPYRGTGLGRDLIAMGLDYIDNRYPGHDTRISAQAHLQDFYKPFGFVPASEPYDEDGIQHIEMLRAAKIVRD